jgi:lactate permease
MLEIWPAILVAGGSFAVTQLLVSNLHGPWLVDIAASVVSMTCLITFLLKWHPKRIWTLEGEAAGGAARNAVSQPRGQVIKAWTPWVILSVLVGLWGSPVIKTALDKISIFKFPVHGLHQMVQRVPPVVTKPTPEPAVYVLNWLSMTGTGIFLAAIISGIVAGLTFGKMIKLYGQTLVKVRFSLLTIAAMLALGFLTRYSGLDATMGLAFARTGALYPFFGTMLGWLGVALTGSDTSSNVLFGSLQKITAQQISVQPSLMASANSVGGVMGKMIDAQSIVVASTATQWYGHEGDILRYVFFHSVALAALAGLSVFVMAYVYPFTQLVLH